MFQEPSGAARVAELGCLLDHVQPFFDGQGNGSFNLLAEVRVLVAPGHKGLCGDACGVAGVAKGQAFGHKFNQPRPRLRGELARPPAFWSVNDVAVIGGWCCLCVCWGHCSTVSLIGFVFSCEGPCFWLTPTSNLTPPSFTL